MKTIFISILVLVVIGAGFYWYTEKMNGEKMEEMIGNESSQGKIDMTTACESAFAYMTFESGEAAEVFVEECKNGEHPEVIERYKADMGLGADAAI